ncbi:hypothetical protein DSECCO2_636630 [anaerobic digester metagenome]
MVVVPQLSVVPLAGTKPVAHDGNTGLVPVTTISSTEKPWSTVLLFVASLYQRNPI